MDSLYFIVLARVQIRLNLNEQALQTLQKAHELENEEMSADLLVSTPKFSSLYDSQALENFGKLKEAEEVLIQSLEHAKTTLQLLKEKFVPNALHNLITFAMRHKLIETLVHKIPSYNSVIDSNFVTVMTCASVIYGKYLSEKSAQIGLQVEICDNYLKQGNFDNFQLLQVLKYYQDTPIANNYEIKEIIIKFTLNQSVMEKMSLLEQYCQILYEQKDWKRLNVQANEVIKIDEKMGTMWVLLSSFENGKTALQL